MQLSQKGGISLSFTPCGDRQTDFYYFIISKYVFRGEKRSPDTYTSKMYEHKYNDMFERFLKLFLSLISVQK